MKQTHFYHLTRRCSFHETQPLHGSPFLLTAVKSYTDEARYQPTEQEILGNISDLQDIYGAEIELDPRRSRRELFGSIKKRYAEFPGKRSPKRSQLWTPYFEPSKRYSEFLGKRWSEFVGKRRDPIASKGLDEFLEKRDYEDLYI
ncbi:hypothetical protein CHS0354_031748 [Potamilus streckersoni]|uniref:Uncharacterized protein n=1 Tax=Potamilus streckersoni TaxID=2493646 RepID=A0AAE0T6X0_9BIVA|nr:hypothetical protein CHS0354_031748 [Potamilus streckersoni]